MTRNGGKIFLAGLLGAIAGAVGGLIFAPKSGKETREDIARMAKEIADQVKSEAIGTSAKIKEVFGTVTEETKLKYNQVRDTLYAKVAQIRSAGEEIDKERYLEIVEDVVGSFRDDLDKAKGGAEKMTEQLKKDWIKVKRALV